jgi:hypothetical protein
MSVIYSGTGIETLLTKLKRLTNPQPITLMQTWMNIIDKDNRRGVMAGLDKDGNPMPPVTYRPVGTALKPTPEQRNYAHPRKGRGKFAGLGSHPSGINNNLSYDEYVRLAGPPLAPRGAFSRVITNLKTRFERQNKTTWRAIGEWVEVVSVEGVEFLSAHFNGAMVGRNHSVQLPVRDLRGVRPEGKEEAREAMKEWAYDQLRTYG